MFVRYPYGAKIDQEIMNHTLGAPRHEPSVEAGHSPALCEHHLPANSSNEDQYPPLPPMRIGATSVSCVVCDTFNENIRRASLARDGERPSTPIVPTSHPDWNVRKWQTRQIAKAFMDNTINSVLDEMGFTPVPDSAPDSDPDDVLGSISFPRFEEYSDEDEEEDESVENEGILSAIQRHGLQRHTLQSFADVSERFRYSSISPTRRSPSPSIWLEPMYQSSHCTPGTASNAEPLSISNNLVLVGERTILRRDLEIDETDPASDSNSDEENHWKNDVSPSSCRCAQLTSSNDSAAIQTKNLSLQSNSSNVPSDNSNNEGSCKSCKPDMMLINTCSNTHRDFSAALVDQEDESCKKRQGKGVVATGISKRRCVESADQNLKSMSSSSLSSHSSSHSRGIATVDGGLMSITSHSSERGSPTFGHFEFMDAAVAAAIQKKGLSSLACQDL